MFNIPARFIFKTPVWLESDRKSTNQQVNLSVCHTGNYDSVINIWTVTYSWKGRKRCGREERCRDEEWKAHLRVLSLAPTPHTHTHPSTPTHTHAGLTGINCSDTHTCPVNWTVSSCDKMQNPDVAFTCRHPQKWNTALLLLLCLSVSLWLSLSLCMFSVSKLETVSSAKRDTKAIVLIQDSKPFRGFRGLSHT